MKNNLSCEIVRDLLPSYVEGLASQTTNEAVEAHLAECTDCSDMAMRMKSPEPEPEQQRRRAEIDYLKGIKRHNWARIAETAVLVAVLVFALFWIRSHLVGREADDRFISCGASLVDETVVLSGQFLTDGMAFGGVSWTEEAGIVTARVKWVEPSVLFFSAREINARYTPQGDVRQIRLGNRILWEEGVSINPSISRIYETAHAYVGDVTADVALANALGIGDRLGPFTNELQTTEEPYGWTICLEEEYPLARKEQIRPYLEGYSCAMLALVDNLGYVSWEYDSGQQTEVYTVTAQMAGELTGADIKSWGGSATAFQELVQLLDLGNTVTQGHQLPMNGDTRIEIISESRRPVLAVEICYRYTPDGEIFQSGGVCNADGESDLFGTEKQVTFDLRTEDLEQLSSPVDMAQISFDLYVTDMEGKEHLAAENICPQLQPGWSCSYTLIDEGDGFALR